MSKNDGLPQDFFRRAKRAGISSIPGNTKKKHWVRRNLDITFFKCACEAGANEKVDQIVTMLEQANEHLSSPARFSLQGKFPLIRRSVINAVSQRPERVNKGEYHSIEIKLR